MEKKLRFAPVVRVSTEKQEERGESLNVQTKQIRQYVKSLNGVVPEYCWKYKGQEHATASHERALLDQLLADSSKDLFDAVIVADTSRWSRDNEKNKAGIKILRNNNIRFFVGAMEFDLFNPEHNFMLGMSAEINELQAKQRNQKSILSRIEIAKRGVPATGKLPYGRTFDKKTGKWGVDREKKAIIVQAAKRYLSGEPIVDIAISFNMNFSNLWKILTQRSGTEWECRFRFRYTDDGPYIIDETVKFTIPRLLDESTIKAIHEKAEANKTYTHGEIKHKYLLSRMIFCSKCGNALYGQINRKGIRYYRHIRPKYRKSDHTFTRFVPANELENSVLLYLKKTFGDVELIEKAVKEATPDLEKVELLQKEQGDLSKDLKKVITQKDHVIDAIADGLIDKAEVKIKMDKLRKREQAIQSRLRIIDSEITHIPDPAKVKKLSKLAMAVLSTATKGNVKSIFKKSYEWKRKLVEHAFAGLDSQGQRLGVYVEQTDDEKQSWRFEIRGTLETTLKALPLSDYELEHLFGLDDDYCDVPKKLKEIRANITNNAYPYTTAILL